MSHTPIVAQTRNLCISPSTASSTTAAIGYHCFLASLCGAVLTSTHHPQCAEPQSVHLKTHFRCQSFPTKLVFWCVFLNLNMNVSHYYKGAHGPLCFKDKHQPFSMADKILVIWILCTFLTLTQGCSGKCSKTRYPNRPLLCPVKLVHSLPPPSQS